jgi:WD40-like Beta Propeller Repeat
VRPRSRRLLAALGALALAAARVHAADWQVVETRHFQFIFEQRDRASVDELLTFCEDVYANVTAVFNSYPDKVPCVLRGRRDDANGLTWSFPSRIDLFVKAPTDSSSGSRTDNWLRLLLTHELTHFVHESMPTGVMHALSSVFGADIGTVGLDLLPGWAIEGPAVYDETVFTSGGRGRNPLFEVYTKAAAEEQSFFSLAQAGYQSAFSPPGRVYVAGYDLVEWMQDAYGTDTLRKIMTAYLDFPFLGPWQAIAKVTGRSADSVFLDMRAALEKKYADATQVRGGALITRRVPGNWTRPQATARGLYAYHYGPETFPSIVRLDPATGNETVLVRADLTDDSSFTASADGAEIWLSSMVVDYSRPAEPRTASDLFVLDRGSTRVRRVTWNSHLWQPAVSPDRSSVVAVQGAGPYSRLVTVDPRTGAMRVLFSLSQGNVFSPALSPDGTKVAFVLNRRGMQDLYVADLPALKDASPALADVDTVVTDVNGDLARPVLGPDPYGEYSPSFMDNGRILFSSDRSGSLCLYVADLPTGRVSRVQEDPVGAIAGVSDGTTLTYASYAGTGYCLKQVPLSGLSPVLLSEDSLVKKDLPAPAEWTGAGASSRPYRGFPSPLFWLPYAVLARNGPAPTDLAFGLGAIAEGGSLLAASSWETDASWLLGVNQPVGGLTVTADFGQLSVTAAGRLSYMYSAGWTEAVDSSAGLDWSPLAEDVLDASRSFSVGIALQHHAELSSASPFQFSDSLQAPGAAWFSYIGVPAVVHWQWSRRGSPLDFTPAPAVDAWLRGTAFLPVLSLAAPQGKLDLFTALVLPSPVPHQVLELGVKAEQFLGSPSGTYADEFTVPRGFPQARSRGLPGGVIVSVDYLAPIALLDQPLLLGWALTAAAVGLHVEGIADFSLPSWTVSFLPVAYAGVDVTLQFTYGSYSVPLGIGVAAAVSTANPSAFDPSRDLGLSLSVGFDSLGFQGTAALSGGARADRGGTSKAVLFPGR